MGRLEPVVSHLFLKSPLPPHLSSQKALRSNFSLGYEYYLSGLTEKAQGFLSPISVIRVMIKSSGFEGGDLFIVPAATTTHVTLMKIHNLFEPHFPLSKMGIVRSVVTMKRK